MADLETYHRIWKRGADGAAPPPDYPGWPEKGLALLGDFSGIQNFVFRPIPGAGGAARRLRSRSFRVGAYTEIIAQWCRHQLGAGANILYSAGGRFLLSAPPADDWQKRVNDMQARIDKWVWPEFGGEIAFHLAAAPFDSAKIPGDALHSALVARRNRPVEYALQPSGSWSEKAFFRPAKPGDGQCDACGMTRHLHTTSDGEDICDGCGEDEQVGKALTRARYVRIWNEAAQIRALDLGMDLHEKRDDTLEGEWLPLGRSAVTRSWPLLRHVPEDAGVTVDFDTLAKRSPGPRKWLGYLRIDVDRASTQFDRLHGDPLRTWALSRFLSVFFAAHANEMLEQQYRNIYAVYGGGDDLFVIGAWAELLHFALALREELGATVGDGLTFSAGLSLAKPHEHILTQATLSKHEIDQAKGQPGYDREVGRDQIRALGASVDWQTFKRVLPAARSVTEWLERRQLSSSFLYQALQLHQDWSRARRAPRGRDGLGFCRYQPLLYYQIQRNVKPGPARNWAQSLLHSPPSPSDWPWADFVIRYAMLARQSEKEEE